MSKRTLLTGASAYAHLAGIVGRRSSRRAEDDRDEDRGGRSSRRSRAEDEDEDREDKSSRRSRAEDDDRDEDRGARRSRAEDDEDDERAEGDDERKEGRSSRRSRAEDDDEEREDKSSRRSRAEDDDDDDREDRSSRRSRAEEEEDDDRAELTGKSAAAQARRRERARCAAIFGCSAAAGNVELAASLAFETTMSRQEAINVLKGQARRGGGDDRRDARGARGDRQNPDLLLGGGGDVRGHAKSGWDRAVAKVGGK